MKLTYIYPQDENLWDNLEWRCHIPVRAINRNGRHNATLLPLTDFVKRTNETEEICERSDMLVVYRNLWGKTLSEIQHWMAHGKVVVADFDEPYPLIPPSSAEHAFWFEGEAPEKVTPVPLVQFKWGLQMSHNITVSTKRLADDWKAFNQVEVIPSFIDLEKYQELEPAPHEGIIFGWSGKSDQFRTLLESGVVEALKQICLIRPWVRLLICSDFEFKSNLLDFPPDQLLFQRYSGGKNWPKPLTYFDVGLAPLCSDYDQRLGGEKLLEYMIMKIPWVASQSAAFHELRNCGWMVENSVGAWQRVLLDMVDHYQDYKLEASQVPYLFGLGQSIDENIQHVMGIYAKIIDNSQTLIKR
ncbi:MAG: hypothetical protein LWX83_02350 [Anaerolineae bacterium]|nr:hypothetical protein [Anaerolineae bacterium]